MTSLSYQDLETEGIGWTEQPVLVYPSDDQANAILQIVTQRAALGDTRANTVEGIMEMLNDETVIPQDRKWDYTIPENLIKVNEDFDSAFSPKLLVKESFQYGTDGDYALSAPESLLNAVLPMDTAAERQLAAQYLVLANRINELRRICELHYRHVHKIHFVYQDMAGYSFTGKDEDGTYRKKHSSHNHSFSHNWYDKTIKWRNRYGDGGQRHPRQYIGAITSESEFKGYATINRGAHFIDYTKPPKWALEKPFNPDMFTGYRITNEDVATKYTIPFIKRVYPDMTPNWIGNLTPALRANVSNNWGLTMPSGAEATPVQGEHINELRRALVAYANHTHDMVLQTIDFKSLDGKHAEDSQEGTAFDISPEYEDLLPAYYVNDLIDTLGTAGYLYGGNVVGLETPLLQHSWYYSVRFSDLDTFIFYQDFETFDFTDERYPAYISEAPGATDEHELMVDLTKLSEDPWFNSAAVEYRTQLTNTSYSGQEVYRRARVVASSVTLAQEMKLVPFDHPTHDFDEAIFDGEVYNILDNTDAAPAAYPIGPVYNPNTYHPAAVYDIKEHLVGNHGYVRISFIPKGLSNINSASNKYRRRAYLLSMGKSGCLGTTLSPHAFSELPNFYFEHDWNGNLKKETLFVNVFARVDGDVFGSVSPMVMEGDVGDGKGYYDSDGPKGIARTGGDDNGRGLIDNEPAQTDIDYDRYYFRNANFQLDDQGQSDGNESWNTEQLKESMQNLVEIWLEASPYREFDDRAIANTDSMWTVHAAVSDRKGNLILHLCGDVIIPASDEDDLHEVELSIDLSGSSYLTFGRSILKLTGSSTVNVQSLSETNNTIVVDTTQGLAPGHLLVVPGYNGDDPYRIKAVVGSDSIQVAEDISDATPSAAISSSVYKYEQAGITAIISQLDASENEAYIMQIGPETAIDNYETIMDILDTAPATRNQIETVRETGLDRIDDELKATTGEANYGDRFKCVNAQRFGEYRVDINEKFDYASGDAVLCLGLPIMALNLDANNDILDDIGGDSPMRYKKFLTDENIQGDDTYLIESSWLNITGKFPITAYGRERPAGSCISAMTSSSSGGGLEPIPYDYIGARGNLNVYIGPRIITVHYTDGTTTNHDVICVDTFGDTESPKYHGVKIYLEDDLTDGKTPEWWEVAETDAFKGFRKYKEAEAPQSTTEMSHASGFDFKSIVVDGVAREVRDHISHGFTLKNHSVVLVDLDTRASLGDVPAIPESFNTALKRNDAGGADSDRAGSKLASPVTYFMNRTEHIENLTPIQKDFDKHGFKSGTIYQFAGVDLKHETGETEKPVDGESIRTLFTSGTSASADSYNVRQVKSTVRDSELNTILEKGDRILASDVNELYRGVEWLKGHTHEFKFIHKTAFSVFVERSFEKSTGVEDDN